MHRSLPKAMYQFLCIALFACSVHAETLIAPIPTDEQKEANSDAPWLEVYGFAQLDYIQDFKRVNPDWEDTLRPSKIPTDKGTYGSDGQSVFGVRQSRFGVQGGSSDVAEKDFFARFEFDMFGVGEDEGKTTPRLRHAYGQWGPVLAGQTHSLFMDINIFPNTVDYWGPTGMVFLRNPQIRVEPFRGNFTWALAIERPSDDIDAGRARLISPDACPGCENLQSDEEIPDFTTHVRQQGDWGHVQLAGILRSIGYDSAASPNNEPKGDEVGWGLNLTGVVKTAEKSALRLGVVYGEGIASYMNDGGTDLAPERNGVRIDADPLPLLGISAYYDIFWTDEISTSIGYSQTGVDNTNYQEDTAFKRGRYSSINLLYSPAPELLMGPEFLWGDRRDNNGETGEDLRLQISFKYLFSGKSIFEKQ